MEHIVLTHTCPHCQEVMPSYFTYKMHLETHRKHTTKKTEIAGVQEKINMALKHGVKMPLTDTQKAAIVARGEARIGLQHFTGYDSLEIQINKLDKVVEDIQEGL